MAHRIELMPLGSIKEAATNPKAHDIAGSGPQFIAAEKLQRRCFGLELEPRYCQAIIERWEKFTGRKHEKL